MTETREPIEEPIAEEPISAEREMLDEEITSREEEKACSKAASRTSHNP